MKITNKFMSLSLAAAALMAVSSCKNSDISFPDFEYSSVYFSNQTPIRTIELGEDYEVDNTLDNEHKFRIGAAFGGSYGTKNVTVDFVVDESLCDGLYLNDEFTIPVKPMPKEYYHIEGSQIKINKDYKGFVDVTLNPAFFEDPIACANIDVKQVASKMMQLPLGCYVIPLRITGQTGVDKILTGEYNTEDHPNGAPSRVATEDWTVAPQDYTLFAVNFMSKYSGAWLRSGIDVINGVEDKSRKTTNKYTIDDEVVYCNTLGLKSVKMPVSYVYDPTLAPEEFEIVLTFDNDNSANANCTVSAPEGAAYTVSGTGKYVEHGAGKYWGNKDRDLITLEYTIKSGSNEYKTSDQLVMQRRCLVYNTFSYFIKSDK